MNTSKDYDNFQNKLIKHITTAVNQYPHSQSTVLVGKSEVSLAPKSVSFGQVTLQRICRKLTSNFIVVPLTAVLPRPPSPPKIHTCGV